MTAPDAEAPYSLRRVQAMLGLSRAVLDGLIAAGFVTPARGPRNALRFSFRDLMLLRTAHALQQAGIAPRRIVRALAGLRARLPAQVPLSGLRITAVGSDVAVHDRNGRWEAGSGQGLMDFEVAPAEGGLLFLVPGVAPARPAGGDAAGPGPEGVGAGHGRGPHGRSRPAAATVPAAAAEGVDADTWYGRALAAEGGDPAAAEAFYRRALALVPAHVDASLNLAALLCEAGRSAEALEICEAALEQHPQAALLHFNRAIALEDAQRWREALASYERSLAIEPDLADAHFNAGRLREQLGDKRGALRHFSAYRRLAPGAPA